MTTPSRAPSRPRRDLQALLIDDDKFMLVVLADMLRDHGITRLSTASSGDEADRMMDRAASPPDLVVCDLNMPGSDGFQFMEKLGARGFAGGVLLVSGMDSRVMKSASLMARFHRLNIIATLAKPVQADALAAALATLA